MKIIVNNDQEKELIQRFVDEMNEGDYLETMGNDESVLFNVDEGRFIWDGFNSISIEIGKTCEMELDHDIVTGKCVQCGTWTEGTLDGDAVSYFDYVNYTSKESIESWKCNTCYDLNEDTIRVFKVHKLEGLKTPFAQSENWCAYSNIDNAIEHLVCVLGEKRLVEIHTTINQVNKRYYEPKLDTYYEIEYTTMKKVDFENLGEFEDY